MSATSAAPTAAASAAWHWSLDPTADGLALRLSGSWRMQDHLPLPAAVEAELAGATSARRLSFDAGGVDAWDTGLLIFVLSVQDAAKSLGFTVDRSGLPEGVRKLLELAAAVPERDTKRGAASPPFLARVGQSAMSALAGGREMITFVGEALIALGHATLGRARFRRVDLMLNIQEAGVNALGIVSLISFLIGLILAFVGAIQLRQFGAQIYIADLVAIGMAREMGAMMAAIIMAGRTGAAFAAQLGTMRVNEEIDALSTMGISPFEFLVLPRMLGLILMMPLLTVYANLVGIAGGAVVGVGLFRVGLLPYWNHTWNAVGLDDFAAGMIKSVVFGVLIAIAGCLRGMQSGRSSAAVGLAATSAVVTGIVFVIVSDAILTVVYDAIGF
ncbi:MAG TPA: MlaE family lipid ABC transporter permease subunit [Candidatus Bathyarchaeia archaeon]|nr:MlaE family lipid ABC transporter permease subunit [Candidatus Bathyarchaeia archaeon]